MSSSHDDEHAQQQQSAMEPVHSSSSSSSVTASSGSFHFSPAASSNGLALPTISPLHSPISPINSHGSSPLVTPDYQGKVAFPQHQLKEDLHSDVPVSSSRPFATRQLSFPPQSQSSRGMDDHSDRLRRVSHDPDSTANAISPASPPSSQDELWQRSTGRTTRAGSDGILADGVKDTFDRQAFEATANLTVTGRPIGADYLSAKSSSAVSPNGSAYSQLHSTTQMLSPMSLPAELDSKPSLATGMTPQQSAVLVRDFGMDVTETEVLALFKSLFPSTTSAHIIASSPSSDPLAIVTFKNADDVQRALLFGHASASGSGLSLHGRTLRISRFEERRAGAGLQLHHSGAVPLSADFANLTQAADTLRSGSQPSVTPLSPTASQFSSTLLPSASRNGSTPVGPAASRIAPPTSSIPNSSDPTNTTVFVGGLPACISEETLKSFFHHFGEITYCKIPPGKGCGFVQFVRRQDAELAIAKMNDFPIHGKSRIRLSWGRSQGDKQIEHVRKLASAIGVPFDAVWRMVQGQEGPTPKMPSRDSTPFGGRNESAHAASRRDAYSAAQRQSIRRELESATARPESPYARVPQNNFMPVNGQAPYMMPLSPPPSGGSSFASLQQQQQQHPAHLHMHQPAQARSASSFGPPDSALGPDFAQRSHRNNPYSYGFPIQHNGRFDGSPYDEANYSAEHYDGMGPLESGLAHLSFDGPSSTYGDAGRRLPHKDAFAHYYPEEPQWAA